MTTTLVVAIGSNGVIGAGGAIPWHLPADLAHFKQLTLGHPLVMGRATFESIGRPLPGRTTIVLTHRPDWSAEGVQVASSLPDALALAGVFDDDVFLVGGAQVYREALAADLVDQMSITRVELAPAGDTTFPEVDWDDWVEIGRDDHPSDDPPFAIVGYRHR